MGARLRSAFRRHERRWMIGYLVVVAIVIGMIGLRPLRDPALQVVDRVLDRADRRWDMRLQHGEALLADGRFAEAATYLARLDSIFPAPTVHAGRDRQRERLLAALALSYERLGRKGRALRAYRQSVAFDPRNWQNHFALARAAVRLDGGWAIPDEARDAYQRVLDIHPNHLPSVRGLMQYYSDRGEFDAVMGVWQTYIDAFMLQLLYVYVGDTLLELNVRVSGEPHDVAIPVSISQGTSRLMIHTGGFSVAMHDASVVTAMAVATSALVDTVRATEVPSLSVGMRDDGAGRLRADGRTSVIALELPDLPLGANELNLCLSVFKPLDQATWDLARRSYQNLLRHNDLEAIQARLLVLPDALWADSMRAIPG